ncbi:AraC family transcriptional regulator [Oxalobacteraceae bacterium OM1]|nr:AraC family transcriptional regulator [Oxalobacteraceae bacterium OM1]
MADRERGGNAKPFGTGRIIFWRGGSIWIGHVTEETGFHDHHAIQVTLALSGDAVHFRLPADDWAPYPAAIVAAHQPHAFKAAGQFVALVFAEPESLEGRALRDRFPEGITALDAAFLTQEAAALAAAYAAGASDDAIASCARAVTAKLAAIQPAPDRPLDKRIARAIDIVRSRLDEAVTMAEVADAVHLSPERFRHVFLQETGVRFRPYVLWLRLETAVALYAAGRSLTEASHAAGFADSAHFSRTFKRMFGVPAIGVQRA